MGTTNRFLEVRCAADLTPIGISRDVAVAVAARSEGPAVKVMLYKPAWLQKNHTEALADLRAMTVRSGYATTRSLNDHCGSKVVLSIAYGNGQWFVHGVGGGRHQWIVHKATYTSDEISSAWKVGLYVKRCVFYHGLRVLLTRERFDCEYAQAYHTATEFRRGRTKSTETKATTSRTSRTATGFGR
jgi:hypothetical protein